MLSDVMLFGNISITLSEDKNNGPKKSIGDTTSSDEDCVVEESEEEEEEEIESEEFESEVETDSEGDTITKKSKLLEDLQEKIKNMINIDSMIDACNFYRTNKKYINRENAPSLILKIDKLYIPLMKLYKLIGMKKAKSNIYHQLLYFLQGLNGNNMDMLHTVIEGPPGVGKSELGLILCELYSTMGVLKKKKNNYVIAKRSDLIGEFLGQTAIKTQKKIDSALGGVLFIDEAYSIGDNSKKDSFAKECVDTLNQNLTENKNNLMCIIAGYKQSLDESFFSLNEGLKRRFNFRIEVEKYTPEELREIFFLKIYEIKWSILNPIEKHCPVSFFKKNYRFFPFFGGDVESFIFCIKLCHSSNLIKNKKKKKKIDIHDLNDGFKLFKENKGDVVEEDANPSYLKMYI